jgi:hypothetical protein
MSRSGGQYIRDPKTGKTRLVKATTKDHPLGNRARNADEKDAPTRVVEKPKSRAKARGK